MEKERRAKNALPIIVSFPEKGKIVVRFLFLVSCVSWFEFIRVISCEFVVPVL